MWICFDPIGSREGWRASILLFIFLYWTSLGIDSSLTNAAASNVPHNTVKSDVPLPASTHDEDDECRNVTTDSSTGMYRIILRITLQHVSHALRNYSFYTKFAGNLFSGIYKCKRTIFNSLLLSSVHETTYNTLCIIVFARIDNSMPCMLFAQQSK